VELTREEAVRRALPNLRAEVMDASSPTLPEAGFDVVASSLVLFFLPDPAAALKRWLRLAVPGGRVAVTTFGPQDEVWRAVDALFAERVPPGMLDARASGTRGPFASDEGMTELFTACGALDVRTDREPLRVVFDDPEDWRTWSMSVGQRAMWRLVPRTSERGCSRRPRGCWRPPAAPPGGSCSPRTSATRSPGCPETGTGPGGPLFSQGPLGKKHFPS
jgi:SAM-dependent methyltransferase